MGRIDDAITLAGALAEAGILRVELHEPGPHGPARALAARATDLPGLLAAAPVGSTLSWPGGSARIEADAITWRGLPRMG